MMTSTEIRKHFLDFFASKKHQIVPSAPIVVKNDPTLLFTNAGMNQFKDFFLGNRKPDNPRIADTQKCLRVSGKHNDLEEVGVDTYHHTMFEMLGNWSFGDYFKAEAIAWSWELLTEVYKLDKDRLYVSIFEGDAKENLPKDEEAYNEWIKWIAEDRILLCNKKDNFWEMGDTGPCGPCTEIHVDCRSDEERKSVDGKTLVNADHPQVIEIWNNVFIQFNRVKDGSLEPLPARHVDTGMGLERLTRVLQQKNSNYDTDIFTRTIAETEKITGKRYTNTDDKKDVAFRVIADHIRAIAFTIADGQLPSNTGAGYVIRRILRRAVRYYYSYLDYKQPLLYELLPVLGRQFQFVFPELYSQLDFVIRVVKEEEDGFLRTLEKGLKKVDEIMNISANIITKSSLTGTLTATPNNEEKKQVEGNTKIIDGKAAFELFDTYGFPLDLTKLIASEKNLIVDEKGFEVEMQRQKNRSRAATSVNTEDWVTISEDTFSEFVGYDSLETKSKVLKYRKVTSKGKEAFQLVLNATPFYAESGGQVGDKGELIFGQHSVNVTDTKKENNLIIHFVDKLPTKIDEEVIARVNRKLRQNTEVHHSATHLLHAALRQVLGTHVAQKGSLVNGEHLRFDFSHFAKVTNEEIAKVESIVNEKIRENVPVVVKQMSKDEAVSMGAMALFGEKYGDVVRVVIMDPEYSVELCGGTHVEFTGELGYFKLKHESAVAAGVRRIEAVSGKSAEDYMNEHLHALQEIKEALKSPKDARKAVEALQAENTELKKLLESVEAKKNNQLVKDLMHKIESSGQINFIGQIVEDVNAESLKKICLGLINERIGNHFIVLCANVDNKAAVVVAIEGELANGRYELNAVQIIKEQIAPIIKGGGGGQKTLATAGGQDASNLPLVIEIVRKLLSYK